MATFDNLRLGTAPDSWGVWFPDDAGQTPWPRFLDEVAEAGYLWIELGPYGYLPTDPGQLDDELEKRSLRLSGGAVLAGLHRGPGALETAIEDCRREARLLTALGAHHLILLPEAHTDAAGARTQPVDLTTDQWRSLVDGTSVLATLLADEFDVSLVLHPHADTHIDTQEHVERFLHDTEPPVDLCLDTGHISYCGGDNLAIIGQFPDRIGYVHLKQVDPAIVKEVEVEHLSFAQAVRRGAMVEPPLGAPAMEPLLEELAGLDVDLFTIVEQDMYPCDPEDPLPIARRTHDFLELCGLGPGRQAI
jgi:inosose dehydratase